MSTSVRYEFCRGSIGVCKTELAYSCLVSDIKSDESDIAQNPLSEVLDDNSLDLELCAILCARNCFTTSFYFVT